MGQQVRCKFVIPDTIPVWNKVGVLQFLLTEYPNMFHVDCDVDIQRLCVSDVYVKFGKSCNKRYIQDFYINYEADKKVAYVTIYQQYLYDQDHDNLLDMFCTYTPLVSKSFVCEKLKDCSMTDVCFYGCDFNLADFRGSDLSGCKFIRCNLKDADFRMCKLDGVKLDMSNIEGADFSDEDESRFRDDAVYVFEYPRYGKY